MNIRLRLSAENLRLSKFEVETLFSTKARLNGSLCSFSSDLSVSRIKKILERSAMIKRAFVDGDEVWRVTQGRFNEREPMKKPKFHPAMLKPKLARTLINLSDAKKTLLDPFCGTGSILIESAVIGLRPTGSDIDNKQVWYSMKNLEHYGLKANLKEMDATNLTYRKKFDALVTDPPYGRSSTLAGKKTKEIYEGFLKSALNVLRPNGRIVLMYPKGLSFSIPKQLKKLKAFDWYVHRSLTRRILVLTN